MSALDMETKRKLREMGAADLAAALEAQDEALTMDLPFAERVRLAVDDAHGAFTDTKVAGLIRRAGLRYPHADLRALDLIEQRGLDRTVLAELATCRFITANRSVVLEGFTGSGKSYLASALARNACHHRIRAHVIRMPDLVEAWTLARDQTQGATKFLRKYAAFNLLVLDEWLLDQPDEATRTMLLELMERRHDTGSTVFATQYPKKDWHQRLGGGVRADAIMDRIVHTAIWINTGTINMRERAARTQTP
ncbi:ATP-binding protein [Raineyella fluvialis]|uniref:ATP-binding protein n=1 Tax=Raineyella fluvialis TaxID=2662261 RepID=A0A5Q2F8H6_9ACTN|nr:ATP-binding protein [Raineyella fluvialis]QGF23129.1 ATP-binding protein [Raineyella fluvialis]